MAPVMFYIKKKNYVFNEKTVAFFFNVKPYKVATWLKMYVILVTICTLRLVTISLNLTIYYNTVFHLEFSVLFFFCLFFTLVWVCTCNMHSDWMLIAPSDGANYFFSELWILFMCLCNRMLATVLPKGQFLFTFYFTTVQACSVVRKTSRFFFLRVTWLYV